MNYDRNGVMVTNTQPKRVLRTARKTITIDSRDRDPSKYVKVIGGASSSDAGDYIVYLPRKYEQVISLRLKSAIVQAPTAGFLPSDMYILLGIEGMNKMDETAPGGDRAGYVDNVFAKIVNDGGSPTPFVQVASYVTGSSIVTVTTSQAHGFIVGQVVSISTANLTITNAVITTVATPTTFVVATSSTATTSTGIAYASNMLVYNDSTYDENVTKYSPPINSLDRFHITWRRHLPYSAITASNPLTAPIVFGVGENSLTFEIEYLENGFDDFSTFETRTDRNNF
jgi:hypothetical protein